jgi:hypothetical protein
LKNRALVIIVTMGSMKVEMPETAAGKFMQVEIRHYYPSTLG